MTYKVNFSLIEENPDKPPLSLSNAAAVHAARVYIENVAIKGKTENEALAEVKSEMERSFQEAWVSLEKILKEGPK
jgi:hypothetical protein